MRKRTQRDHVVEEEGFKEEITTDKLRMPGIEILHLKPIDEIAEALTVALRSRPNVLEIRYVVGKYIEITTGNPPAPA